VTRFPPGVLHLRRSITGLALAALIGACSAGAQTTPSPTPTPTPTPTPLPSSSGGAALAISAAAKGYLVNLTGYTYEPLPANIEQQLALTFGSNPAAAGAMKGYAATAVNKGSTGVALIIVIELDPSLARQSGAEAGFWAGAAANAGGQLSEATIAGKKVHIIEAQSSNVVGWMDSALAVMVIGSDANQTNSVAEALIKAHA